MSRFDVRDVQSGARATWRAVAIVVVSLVACLAACRSPVVVDADLEYVEVFSVRADTGAPLPLLVAIHGLGDKPETFCEFMRSGVSVPARIVCPQAPTTHGQGFSWFPPMRTLTSAERMGDALRDAGELVAQLTTVLMRDPLVLGDPILTGYSQGGMISYYLAAQRPELFAAVVPIAGMLPAPLRAEVSAGDAIPLYGFHGEADEMVPFTEAKRTAAAFAERWPETEFSTYDGVGHRLSAKMREDIFARLNGLLRMQSEGR